MARWLAFAEDSTDPLDALTERPTGDGPVSERGTCGECGYRFKLKKDGTLMAHNLWHGTQATECAGGGKSPKADPLSVSRAPQEPLHPSWREASREQLLEQLVAQGATSKA